MSRNVKPGFPVPGIITVFLFLLNASTATSYANYNLDISAGLGRRFDGVGAMSGGGATSKLLPNYPEKQRDEILDFLFKPNFGASLHIFKVEIGGDTQSSEGTEASHMHHRWDENYHRGYEWWMMKEAKKRNPDIKLYGLPWGFPGWLGNGTWWPYRDPVQLAGYITRWIQGAKMVHNLTIDYIGIWNEKPYDITYVITLRKMLNSSGLSHVQIVVGDDEVPEAWEVADDMTKYPEFKDVVDIIGVHYPNSKTSKGTQESGKPVWSSEDHGGGTSDKGAKCWAHKLNNNYVTGYMTNTLCWNVLAAYYDDLPYRRTSLMLSNEPWSGHYEVSPPIWATAHTTQFTAMGWHYLKHGSGVDVLQEGGSIVSLISPDKKHFTIIVETTTDCGGSPPTKPQNITLTLKGKLATLTEFNMWVSSFSGNKEYFINKGKIQVKGGQLNLSLGLDQVVTLTTISTGNKGSYEESPPSKPYPLPYADDFQGYKEFQEPFNFVPQVGSFEVLMDGNTTNKILQQTVLDTPVHWCPIPLTTPVAFIGNYNWSDISVSIDARVPHINGSRGIVLGVHIDQGGCYSLLTRGVFVFVLVETQKVVIATDLERVQVIDHKFMRLKHDTWYHVSLTTKGALTTVTIDGVTLYNSTIDARKNGFVAVGADTFGLAEFDNLNITSS